ncbi:MAG: radical SAM protein [Spirochaetaceae bacterium]|jgi:hypothetical protein|nr:radical SAM protein [Spirochaetaceae bacterium]
MDFRIIFRQFFRKIINPESRLYKNLQSFYHYIASVKRFRKRGILSFNVAITKHCNLNCAYCYAFSPVAEESYYDIDVFKKDIRRISELTNRRIKNFSISGGEPLLHPELADFLESARKYFDWLPQENIGNIFIITNGTLLLKQPESFWNSCKENNIEIRITKYPIRLDIDTIRSTAQKYGIKLTYYSETDKVEKKMDALKLDISGQQDPVDSFIRCFLATDCVNLYKGRLYVCFIPVNIDSFNKHFNLDIALTGDDSIDIYKVSNINEIFDFLRKPIPFCRYCDWKNSKPNLTWRVSKKDLSEWT